jgi:hypothetical protein
VLALVDRVMRRRPKPTKRTRARRVALVHRNHLQPARLFRIYPDADEYPRAVVEVRLCRDTRRLCDSLRQQGWPLCGGDDDSAGLVRSGFGRLASRSGLRWSGLLHGRVVAQMWLSVWALQSRPGEITSHECGHAAMVWTLDELDQRIARFMPEAATA